MILPQTLAASLAVLLVSLACLSLWATTYKVSGKLRYEFYYLDWIVGALLCVTAIALTAGSLGFDGFSFRDDLMIAARKSWLFAFVAGGLFGLGNLLLMASLSLAGMGFAFTLAGGTALCLASPVSFFLRHDRPVTFLILGCSLAAAACVFAARVNRRLVLLRHEQVARAGKAKSTRRPSSAKPVILGVIGGLRLAAAAPLGEQARAGEIGLGPYSFSFLFTFGAAASGLLLNLFLMNLPVEGEPLEIPWFFRERVVRHLFGLAGGAIWSLGLVAALVPVARAAPPEARAQTPLVYGITEGASFFAALCGLFLWKELRAGDGRMAWLAALMLGALGGGIAVLSLALLYRTQ